VQLANAFCVGNILRGRLKKGTDDIDIYAGLPHQQLVTQGSCAAFFVCPRLGEVPPLARQAIAAGIASGEHFDAALRGQYFVDALKTDLADAKSWGDWALDAFACSARAFAAASAKRKAQEMAGADVIASLNRLYEKNLQQSDGTFAGAVNEYMTELTWASLCPAAQSFDQIAKAADYALWAPIADVEWGS
jgi:hypothetical protein